MLNPNLFQRDKPEALTIDISDLPKEKVIIALFENVYIKSGNSYRVWQYIVNEFHPFDLAGPVGTYGPPTEAEAREILDHNSDNIDYIGVVKFGMNFSGSTIDATIYDTTHNTVSHTNGMLTAQECVNKIKQEFQAHSSSRYR